MDLGKMFQDALEEAKVKSAEKKAAIREMHDLHPEVEQLERSLKELKERYPIAGASVEGAIAHAFDGIQEKVGEILRIVNCAPDSLREWGFEEVVLLCRLMVWKAERSIAAWKEEWQRDAEQAKQAQGA